MPIRNERNGETNENLGISSTIEFVYLLCLFFVTCRRPGGVFKDEAPLTSAVRRLGLLECSKSP